jgi:hypothetical protein
VDRVLLVAIGVLVVFDIACITVLQSTAPHQGAPVIVVWLVGQVLICFLGGGAQIALQSAGRDKRFTIAATAAVLLAVSALLAGDSSARSTACSSARPCDTSFGLGALVIGAVSLPLFFGAVALGRVIARRSRGGR